MVSGWVPDSPRARCTIRRVTQVTRGSGRYPGSRRMHRLPGRIQWRVWCIV